MTCGRSGMAHVSNQAQMRHAADADEAAKHLKADNIQILHRSNESGTQGRKGDEQKLIRRTIHVAEQCALNKSEGRHVQQKTC